jgi:single-stranded DNA-binding protein
VRRSASMYASIASVLAARAAASPVVRVNSVGAKEDESEYLRQSAWTKALAAVAAEAQTPASGACWVVPTCF